MNDYFKKVAISCILPLTNRRFRLYNTVTRHICLEFCAKMQDLKAKIAKFRNSKLCADV
ncbi:hypothetical protein [uncultured Ruminococcus sp.]|uniref:hypothetical protein n=1 Tax=uncultured Ruminococcus sp. TaxID=165186 RepID=UPI0025EE590B|nr:hypothetical protein [uncultured Ruminococcus sp.]